MAKANRVYPQKAPVTKNQEVEGEVVDITYQGMGVVKIDNFPIFVVDAIPGEIVRLGITKVQKNFAFGRVIKRLQESPNRVQNANQIAITTGIAPLANLKYDAQLEFKQRQVEQLFKKVNIEYIDFFRYNHYIMYLINKKTTIYCSFLIFLIRTSLKGYI